MGIRKISISLIWVNYKDFGVADIRLISNSNLKNEIQVLIRLDPALTVVGPVPLAGSALVKQSNLPAPPANSIAFF